MCRFAKFSFWPRESEKDTRPNPIQSKHKYKNTKIRLESNRPVNHETGQHWCFYSRVVMIFFTTNSECSLVNYCNKFPEPETGTGTRFKIQDWNQDSNSKFARSGTGTGTEIWKIRDPEMGRIKIRKLGTETGTQNRKSRDRGLGPELRFAGRGIPRLNLGDCPGTKEFRNSVPGLKIFRDMVPVPSRSP